MYTYQAVLSRVVDGDTMDIVIDVGFRLTTKQRIRLAKINTPEIFRQDKNSEEYKRGIRAKNFVEQRLKQNHNKMAIQTSKRQGKFGRYLGTILLEDSDLSLNEELIREGLAEPA